MAIILTEKQINDLYETNRAKAIGLLKKLDVYCRGKVNVTGLNGWVYEQTIQYCMREELNAKGIEDEISEQANIGGRARADLRIGRVVVEVKAAGLFGRNDITKYGEHKRMAKSKGLSYLYVTRQEGYGPYRTGTVRELGKQNAFFLDEPGEWKRFMTRLVALLK
jgi:hypothetical protein